MRKWLRVHAKISLWLPLLLLLLLLLILMFQLLVWQAASPLESNDAVAVVAATADTPVPQPLHTSDGRNFTLGYSGGGTYDDDDDDGLADVVEDKVLRLQPTGLQLHQNVCFCANGTRLRLRRAADGEDVWRGTSVVLARAGCGAGTVSREMARLFVWLQQWESPSARNASLLHVRVAGGGVVAVPRTQRLAVVTADGSGGRCEAAGEAEYDRLRLLHWIRVVTGLFQLPPWWSKDEAAAGRVAPRHVQVVVDVLQGTTGASLSVSSVQELGCFEYALLAAAGGSPRWFPSELWAHRFRLRWLHYLHCHHLQQMRMQTAEATAAAVWGTQPVSPVLRRMLIAAVDDDHDALNAAAPAVSDDSQRLRRPHRRSSSTSCIHNEGMGAAALASALVEAPSLGKARPLQITMIVPRADSSHDARDVASYLHEKFGQAGRIQLIYVNAASDERKKLLESGSQSDRFGVHVVRDEAELLLLLALTDVLVAPHSTALAALVAMQPGSVVVELFPHRCRSLAHVELAAAMHVSYIGYEESGDRENSNTGHNSMCVVGQNASVSAAGVQLRFERGAACRQRRDVRVSALRLYHVVKSGLSAVLLRNSRFFGVMAFDRR
ncbi:hypothetical protein DQ04_12801010 [Trypanosoma grayi]|uniref:hypothetical protein n=1 Tax=Trypanosoma grayi TaxID=71804 RepID=UPI0004F47C74|nr:hypothetical protein DQ04_12801010 [Trypanosoma grayi]KEG06674.1 hypothetical protein DQ04_12801010 [Trypanosoma grayi]